MYSNCANAQRRFVMNENTIKLIKIVGIIIACVFASCMINIILEENETLPEPFGVLVYTLIGLAAIGGIVAVVTQRSSRTNSREEQPGQEPRQEPGENHQAGQDHQVRH